MKLSIYSRPPEDISKEIRLLIKEISKTFGKNRSSAHPLPHMTLRSSLKLPKKDFSKFVKHLKNEFNLMPRPIVEINGWNFAPKNLDIYGFHLNVKRTKELTLAHEKLEKLFPKYEKTYIIKKFEPHISLAWEMKNNMKKEQFDNTLQHMQNIKKKLKWSYKLDSLYIHEEVSKNNYKLIKIIK